MKKMKLLKTGTGILYFDLYHVLISKWPLEGLKIKRMLVILKFLCLKL